MTWIRRNALAISVVLFGLASFAAFTWAEYGYFCDQAASHKEPCAGFWSSGHLHDWIYNAASNYQSEALVGIGFVIAFKRLEGRYGRDRDV